MAGALFNSSVLAESLVNQSIQSLLKTRQEERERYLRIMWDYYHGRHAQYFRRLDAEDDKKFNERQNRAFIDNLCRAVVDKSVSYLYGQGEKIVRRFKKQNVSELMTRVYKYNDMPNFMINTATMGGVEGNCLVKHILVDSRTDQPFLPETTPAEIKEFGIIKYLRFSGMIYTPVYQLQDYTKLTGVILHYWEDKYTGVDEIEQLLNRKSESKEVLEYTTDTEWYRWTRTAKERDWKEETIFPETEYKNKNPYGKLSTVYTECENLPSPDCHEGVGDLDDIVGLNLHLDERRTDEIYTIIHHIYPILVITGAEIADFIRSAKSILQLPAGAEADYLTWDNKIDAALKVSEELKRSIYRSASLSGISFGESVDMGNLRSGAALRVLFAPAIERTVRKQKSYGRAEKQMAEATLRMWEFHTGETFVNYELEIEYPQDFVPSDELNEAQIESIDLDNGVRSRMDVIAKKHPNLTNDEVKQKFAQCMDELEMVAQMKPQKQPGITKTPEQKMAEQE